MAAAMDATTSAAALPGNLHETWTGPAFAAWQARTNTAVTTLTAAFVRLGVFLLAGTDAIFNGDPALPGLPTDAPARAVYWRTLMAAALNFEPRLTLAGDADTIRPASQEATTTAAAALPSIPNQYRLVEAFIDPRAALAWKFLPRPLAVMLYTWLTFVLGVTGCAEASGALATALEALLPDHMPTLTASSLALRDSFPPYDFTWNHAPLYLRVTEHLAASLSGLLEPLESGRLQFCDTLSWVGLAALRLAQAGVPSGNAIAMPFHVPRDTWVNLTTPTNGWESLPERSAREAAASLPPPRRSRGPTSRGPTSSGPGARAAKRPKTSAAKLRDADYPDRLRMLSVYQMILGREAVTTQEALQQR